MSYKSGKSAEYPQKFVPFCIQMSKDIVVKINYYFGSVNEPAVQ